MYKYNLKVALNDHLVHAFKVSSTYLHSGSQNEWGYLSSELGK